MAKIINFVRPEFTRPGLLRRVGLSRSAAALQKPVFQALTERPSALDLSQRISNISSVGATKIGATVQVGNIQGSLAEAQEVVCGSGSLVKALKSGDPTSISSADVLKETAAEIARTNKLLYPGSARLIENTQASLNSSAKWHLPEISSSLLFSNGLVRAVGMLFLCCPALAYCGTGAAAAMGGSLFIGAVAGLAAFKIVSSCLKARTSHSVIAKITGLGQRLLPWAIIGGLAYGAQYIAGMGGDITAALRSLMWQIPVVLGAGIGAVGFIKTKSEIKRAVNSQKGSSNPAPVAMIKQTMVSSNITIGTETHYLATRATLLGVSFLVASLGMAPVAVAGVALMLRGGYWLNKHYGARAGEWLYQRINGGLKNKHPITALTTDVLIQMASKFGPAMATGLLLSGGGIFFPFLTLLVGGWAMWGDWHAGIAAIGSALEAKRSVLNPLDLLISDAFKSGLKKRVIRLNPYVNEIQRNFSKVVNMLVTPYPFMQHVLCGEWNPYDGAGDVRKIRATREKVHSGIVENWQKEIYEMFQGAWTTYLSFCDKDKGCRDLVDILNELGRRYGGNDPDCYIPKLRKWLMDSLELSEEIERLKKIQENINENIQNGANANAALSPAEINTIRTILTAMQNNLLNQNDLYYVHKINVFSRALSNPRFKADSAMKGLEKLLGGVSARVAFDVKGDALNDLVRKAYDVLRIQSEKFHELAERLERQRIAGSITGADLRRIYRKYLGIYSARMTHGLRKSYTSDDKIATKSWNLAFYESHIGDTLYEVGIVPRDGSLFIWEAIPSKYVRFDNPGYDHTSNTKKYIWIHRDDVSAILGLSCSASNEMAQVNNDPYRGVQPEREIELGGKRIRTTRYHLTDDAVLQPHGMIWRSGCSLGGRHIWIAGQGRNNNFIAAQHEWARKHFGKDGKRLASEVGKNGLAWIKDEPEVLCFDPAEQYLVSDEAYVDFASPVELQAEIAHTQDKMNLRLFGNMPWSTEIPLTCLEGNRQNAEHIKYLRKQDSLAGIKYTFNGQEYSLPFPALETISKLGAKCKSKKSDIEAAIQARQNRPLTKKQRLTEKKLNKPFWDEPLWKFATEGEIVRTPSGEIQKIDIYGNIWGVRVLLMEVSGDKIPASYIHPGVTRIEIDSYSPHLGARTWMVLDYGGRYGAAEHDRYRYVPLDPAKAKEMFWENHITGLSVDKGILRASGSAPIGTRIYPLDAKWVGQGDISNVLRVEAGDKIWADIRPDGSVADWSLHKHPGWQEVKGGLLLVIGQDGSETVVPVEGLPAELSRPDTARKTIDVCVENGQLVFNLLRMNDRTYDNPDYIYSLKDASNMPAGGGIPDSIDWLLDSKELTVTVSAANPGQRTCQLELRDDRRNLVGTLSSDIFQDDEGRGFLDNEKCGMSGMDSFYQSASYERTFEYRPRLIKKDGKIMLILTRADKERAGTAGMNSELLQRLNNAVKMFYSVPTSAAVVEDPAGGATRRIPLSLTDPVPPDMLTPPGLIGTIEIRGGQNPTYMRVGGIDRKDLEKIIRVEVNANGTVTGYGLKNEAVNLAPDAERTIKKLVAAKGLSGTDVGIILTHPWRPDIVKGEYDFVVHRQTQNGAQFAGGCFAPAVAAEYRDIYFYGATRELGSDAIPPWSRSAGLQPGRTQNYDSNDLYAGSPIENGTPMQDQLEHLMEVVRISMGLPQDCSDVQVGRDIGKFGGFETLSTNPYFNKVVGYFRELGWFSGVSEDEQYKIALQAVLGHRLRYFTKVTGIESQPALLKQLSGQDNYRYNLAMQLARDVQMKILGRQAWEWYWKGKPMPVTFKESFEAYLFSGWYKVPAAELARKMSPAIFLWTLGLIKPYPVDLVYFTFAAFLPKLLSGVYNYALHRYSQGYCKENEFGGGHGHSPLWWALKQGPTMTLGLLLPAFRSFWRLDREDAQYARYVTTALGKEGRTPRENGMFLSGLFWMNAFGLAFGLAQFSGVQVEEVVLKLGIVFNMLWGGYSMLNDHWALKWLKVCEDEKTMPAPKQRVINKITQLKHDFNAIKTSVSGLSPDPALTNEENKRNSWRRFLSGIPTKHPAYKELMIKAIDEIFDCEWAIYQRAVGLMQTNPAEARRIFGTLAGKKSVNDNMSLLAEGRLKEF